MAQYNNKLGELRPNQIITTFGPGSIIDAVKDSVTMLDTSYWTEDHRWSSGILFGCRLLLYASIFSFWRCPCHNLPVFPCLFK